MIKIKNMIKVLFVFILSFFIISNITYADQVKQDKYKKVLSTFMINKSDTDENKYDYLNRFSIFLNEYKLKIDNTNKNYELIYNLIPVVELLKVEYDWKIKSKLKVLDENKVESINNKPKIKLDTVNKVQIIENQTTWQSATITIPESEYNGHYEWYNPTMMY